MSKGYSIHIGVDYVDRNHYNSSLPLSTCVSDANSMETMAKQMGFKTEILVNENATSKNIIASISKYFTILDPKDILFISFSGHGSKVEDHETWNVYDRMLFDVELKELWNGFKNEVRILVVSDSCHSGDIVRLKDIPYHIKGIHKDKGENIHKEHKSIYDSITMIVKETPKANVKLLAACDKDSLAYILRGDLNSVFTKAILDLWNIPDNIKEGKFKGNYEWVMNSITDDLKLKLKIVEVNQIPVILNYPTENSFNDDLAFTI